MYPERDTIAQKYHDRDTFDFSQGSVAKNQPMAVPLSLSESLGISREVPYWKWSAAPCRKIKGLER